MKINFDKVYDFDLRGTVSFGDLPEELLYEIFKDGRVSSKLLEYLLEIYFPDLEYVDKKGYDYIHLETGELFEKKQFTSLGLKYCPSSMIGSGRKFNEVAFLDATVRLNFIIVATDTFPTIKVLFIRGLDLLRKCDYKFSIPYSMKPVLFDEKEKSTQAETERYIF